MNPRHAAVLAAYLAAHYHRGPALAVVAPCELCGEEFHVGRLVTALRAGGLVVCCRRCADQTEEATDHA